MRRLLRIVAGAATCATAAYATSVAVTWLRFGRVAPGDPCDADALLERFMPAYDVAEQHRLGVAAAVSTTFAVSTEMNLNDSPIVRAIFKAREVALGAAPAPPSPGRRFVEEAQALGWRVLAEVPGREIVMGAVTQPWQANVVFRPLPPDEFIAFNEPGYVKIAWTIRADSDGPSASVARTETRALATDAESRRLFRRYWSFVSPGVVLIRLAVLRQIRTEAERRARQPLAAGTRGAM